MVIQNAKHRQEAVDKIRQAVEAGKTVVAPCWGDAMVYGTLWYLEMLPKDFPSEVIPGVGAFEAGSAALKKSTTFGWDTNSVILTMGDFVGRVDTNEKLMRIGTSLVIYTMHLDYPKVFGQLKRHYPANTPVAVVCYAGDPEKQKVIYSTVGRFLSEVDYQNLPADLHILFVGKFLEKGQARIDGLIARVGSSSASTAPSNPVASAGRSSVRGGIDRARGAPTHGCQEEPTRGWAYTAPRRGAGAWPAPLKREGFPDEAWGTPLDCTGSAAAGGAAGGSTQGAQRRAHRLRQWEGCRNGGL